MKTEKPDDSKDNMKMCFEIKELKSRLLFIEN